jgi:protein-disulfide isomerase
MTLSLEAPAHVRGPKDAPVTLSEFGDFECPYCGAAYPLVRHLERNYINRIRFAFFEFPLRSVHPHAELAAEAAEAAGAQGLFWPMFDMLFDHQRALNPPDLLRYAAAIKVPDLRRFEHELGTHAYARQIDESIALGESLGVEGTPAFFIDDVMYEGEYTYSAIASVIDRVLAESPA